jgi:outer membrane protein OmpA-like peptidoglycan-associated protein
MAQRYTRAAGLVTAILLISTAARAQDEKKVTTAPSLDGTSGLFKTWDAQTLRKNELNLSLGYSHYNRDPGELIFRVFPVAAAWGVSDRFEVFGSFDVYKRVAARSILERPLVVLRAAATPLGATSFNNEAPFIGTRLGDGTGDVHLGAKISFLGENFGNAFSMGAVGFIKLPTHTSVRSRYEGLGTGEIDGGFGWLISKTAGKKARFHLNTMVNLVQDVIADQRIDLQKEFLYRGGASFPASGPFQVIAELDGTTYFGKHTPGANPRSPIDLVVGVRAYPREWVALSAGYRATFNHISEDISRRLFAAGTNGMVAQVAFMRRMNHPPTVSCAVSNATIKQDEKTTVRANGADPDNDKLTYSWSTSGGKVTGSGDTVTFDATGVAPGKYTVTATVSDGKHQASCTAEITVVKKNLPPTVSCSPPSTEITVGETATIRATASDPNNDTLTYTWTVNGQRVAADGATLSFGSSGRQPGTYTVNVTVSDGELTASCSSTVTVRPAVQPNRPPTIECLTTSVDVAAGGSVQLRVRASDPDPNDRVTITWSATGGTVSGSGDSASFNASGLRAGIYSVTATVEDGRGGRASCNMTVNVSERFVLPGGFARGSARIDNKAKAALDDLAVRMQNDPRLRANIVGYSDNTRADRGLGIKRAKAAADYLIKKGIDASRLMTTDGGTNNPVADNKTEAGRKQNRRVEIELNPR